MAKWSDTFKKIFKNNKTRFVLLSLFVFFLIIGIQVSHAFYNTSAEISILTNKVGDFELGDGDINVMIYRENDDGKFELSYAIPALGYVYNSSLTTCTIPCDTNTSSDCYYSVSSTSIELNSKEKVTCKFYFEKEAASDVNVYILREDAGGTYTYNSKNYSLINGVPAYGYEYVNYTCDSDATLTYDAETKNFSVETTERNTCYAYFDSVGSSDVTAKVYVQSASGSTVYNEVNVIPANNTYKLSTTKTSYCYDDNNTTLSTTITYVDGYININATSRQTCEIYLDLE